jgi:hypothetical protein
MPDVSGIAPGELIGISFFGLFIVAAAMWAGARLANIRTATFGQAFIASIAASLTTFASLQAGAGIGGPGGALVVVGGAALVVYLIRVIFATTTGKALMTYCVNVLVQMITAGLMYRMLGLHR